MLWVKTFHIVLIASWFAGLFYLPRIFVNLAMETEPAATARLLLMARKLFRFMTVVQTFKTWSLLETIISVMGLGLTFALAAVL